MQEFNSQDPSKQYSGKDWRALLDTPEVGGKLLHPAATSPGEPCPSPKFSEHLPSTPFANQLELNFAAAATRNERLGHGPATDLLAI